MGELEAKQLAEWLVDRAMEHHRPTVLFEHASSTSLVVDACAALLRVVNLR